MEEILKQISVQSILLGDEDFTELELTSKWLGKAPAPVEAITAAENRLGISFPDDYKKFLRICNGFSSPSNATEPFFDPVERIDYLRNLDPELIVIWSEHEELQDIAQQLKESIRIGDSEQLFLLIPPSVDRNSWKYWKFASWIPGEEEFKSLHDYFQQVLAFLRRC